MHLDVRSWFSFHDGVASPEALCEEAFRNGYDTLGMADVDATHGLIRFYRAAVHCGLRPLLGLSLTDPRIYTAKGGESLDPSIAAATVIAADRDGYSEVCALAAARHIDPRFDLGAAIERHSEHCFVITDQPYLLQRLARSLGPKRLRVRVNASYGSTSRARQLQQLKLARSWKLDPVACTDVRFLHPQDQHVHAVLRAIGQNTDLQRVVGVRGRSHYLAAPVELPGYYFDCPEAVANVAALAQRCNVELELDKWLPPISLSESRDACAMLRTLCEHGRRRYVGTNWDGKYAARLDYELGVIEAFGFTEYFLFIHDILEFARRERIPYLGRGSAGNSLVSYLLGITPVDPIEQNLWFERFINKDRKSPPDVDIDFASNRRDEVIRYLQSRWGSERVAMVCTLNCFRSRGAVREVGKVFGLDEREISKVTRQMPSVNAGMLPYVQQQYAEMRGVDLTQEPYRQVIPLAARLDGVPHHVGVHCAGMVVAPTRLTNFTGLQHSAEGLVITQYDMYDIERIGLIKVDILGNCGLQAMDTTLRSLDTRGIHPPVQDWKALVQDERTRRSVAEGRTMGCFYVESSAMLQLQRKLNPDSFEDLTIATSIIRPGVAQSGMMDEYIRRSKGQPQKMKTHWLLEKMLPETHGVMVFQEDVIKVAMELAGLSAVDADMLRRAMSGKSRGTASMAKVRETFIEGCCRRHGIEYLEAAEVWRQVASFSGYSFCKSHSACFSVLSYQVVYLKEYFPAEYMAAVLSHDGGFYSNSAYISECKRMGLKVLLPDVNHSHMDYRAESDRSIRVSLLPIANIRHALKERIVRERERGGHYRSLADFIRRCRPQKGELDILVQCGALDSLGLTRPELQWQTDQEFLPVMRRAGSLALPFDEADRSAALGAGTAAIATDYDAATRLRLEQQHLGMLVSCHPLELVQSPPGVVQAIDLPKHTGRTVRLLGWCIATKRVGIGDRQAVKASLGEPLDESDTDPAGFPSSRDEHVSTAEDLGLVRSEPVAWRSGPGKVMKFMSMEDTTARYELVVFPQVYRSVAHITMYQGPFLVEGVVKNEFGECVVEARNLRLLD
jgi:DNA-directed DNA polymerase III PolC